MTNNPARKSLSYYMRLPYTYTLIPDPNEGGYAIKVNELPGCLSQGDTAEEAMMRIREAMELWIQGQLEDRLPVPEPGEKFSGQIKVHVPKSVHRALAQAAEREGISLNAFVASTLSAVAGTEALPPKKRMRGGSEANS